MSRNWNLAYSNVCGGVPHLKLFMGWECAQEYFLNDQMSHLNNGIAHLVTFGGKE